MGSDEYNLSLSENRANAVKAALVGKGIQATRIVTVGKGEGVPVASNDNSAGRQQNRRVEIIVAIRRDLPTAVRPVSSDASRAGSNAGLFLFHQRFEDRDSSSPACGCRCRRR